MSSTARGERVVAELLENMAPAGQGAVWSEVLCCPLCSRVSFLNDLVFCGSYLSVDYVNYDFLLLFLLTLRENILSFL